MTSFIKEAIKKIPAIRQLIEDVEALKKENAYLRSFHPFAPPGHYNSPIPNVEEVLKNQERIWGHLPKSLPGIDLRAGQQLALVRILAKYAAEFSFPYLPDDSSRYYVNNPAYGNGDGLYYFCMLRYLQPKRLIEVGSGYSSALALDVNERYLNDTMDCTFIEPYPELLKKLLKSGDEAKITLHDTPLQEMPLSIFKILEEGDILFIDSTHVAKIGSDVNYLIHEVLPVLNKGVFIHIHDIAYPFQYNINRIREGCGWNESYILRAFLQFNTHFEIVLFTTYLLRMHRREVTRILPGVTQDPGASLWLQKV